MAISNVFYTKIVNNDDEEDGETFVAPKARRCGGLVVPFCVEASFEELVGEYASPG